MGNTENKACEWFIATVVQTLRVLLRTPAPPIEKTRTGPTRREQSTRERKRARQLARPIVGLSGFGIPPAGYRGPEPEEDWGAEDWARVPMGSLLPDDVAMTAASA